MHPERLNSHQNAQGWHVDVLPPSTDAPELGYIEFAGWVANGQQMLAAREVKKDGRFQRSFEPRNRS